MKIVLFGGRFDPPHFGHLILGRDLIEKYNFSKINYLVNFDPPHKKAEAHYIHRVRMLKILLKDENGLEVDTFEGDLRISPSYTYDVLKEYSKRFKGEIYFVLGSDQMAKISTWKNYRKLPNLAKFIVLSRGDIYIPGDITKIFKPVVLKHRRIEISSSEIRMRIARGESIRGLTSEGVIDYINHHMLYREEKKVEVFIDGSARENPGNIRIAFVVMVDGTRVFEFSKEAGFGTNNEAEYLALLEALRWLKDRSLKKARIYTDSSLVANQINGKFKVKSKNLQHLNGICRNLIKDTESELVYIPRKGNLADKLTRNML